MTSRNSDGRRQALTDQTCPRQPCDDAQPDIDARSGADTAGARLSRFRVLSRQGEALVDVTDQVCPMALKATEVVVIINGDTADLEKVILNDQVYQFHLAATAVGVCGQYADGNGAVYPDVWYAAVKPQFRS